MATIMNTPKISILIPYYNHNKFITQTLNSIIEDTYSNKEIIIINDGSPDLDDSNIIKWIELHQNEIYVQYIKRENKGLTKTFNELIGLASGQYIIACASDDYLINNTITERVDLLEKTPNKMILLSDTIIVDENSKLISNSNLEYRNQTVDSYTSTFKLKKMIVKKWGLAGATWIAKKDLFTTIGLLDETLIVEDWDFMLRVASKNLALFYPNQKVSAYRLHPNNTINNPDKQIRMWEDLYYTAKKHIKSFQNPYFKYLMWKNSRKNLKKLNKLKKAQAGHTSD